MTYTNDPRLSSVDKLIKENEELYIDLAWENDPSAYQVMVELERLYSLRQAGELYIPNF